MRFLKQSHSAEKPKRETLWAFCNLQKNFKNLKGDLWRQKIEKSRTVPKKFKGGTL